MRRLSMIIVLLALSGCGYNTFQTQDEQIKASWAEVVNQYQRRADLIPNLVETVRGFAQQERDEGAAPADGYAFFGNGQRKLAQALADIRTILNGPSIQVRCLECPTAAPAKVERRDAGFMASLAEWLL